MDTTDRAILALLQRNARMPLSEIAQKLSLSLPAVSKRVSKLENTGVIMQYTTILNPEKFEKKLTCYCMVVLKEKNMEYCDEFTNFASQQDDIMECYCITGEFEYLLKIVTTSTQELEELLVLMRRRFHLSVASSHIVLTKIKAEHSIKAT